MDLRGAQAALDPDNAGSELEQIKMRLARAGLLARAGSRRDLARIRRRWRQHARPRGRARRCRSSCPRAAATERLLRQLGAGQALRGRAGRGHRARADGDLRFCAGARRGAGGTWRKHGQRELTSEAVASLIDDFEWDYRDRFARVDVTASVLVASARGRAVPVACVRRRSARKRPGDRDVESVGSSRVRPSAAMAQRRVGSRPTLRRALRTRRRRR